MRVVVSPKVFRRILAGDDGYAYSTPWVELDGNVRGEVRGGGIRGEA